MKKTYSGLISLLTAGVLFGSFGVWVRLLSSDLSSYQQIAFRNIVALIIAILIIFVAKIKLNFNGVSKKNLLLFGLSFPTAVVFYTASVLNTSIMLSIFSFYFGSIFASLLLGIIIFQEKLTRMKVFSMLAVLIGFYILVQPEGIAQIDRGMLYGVVAGLFDTISNVFRKHLSGKLDRVVLTLVPQIGGLLVATSLMAYFGDLTLPTISPTNYIVGLIFGGMIFAINYLTLYGFQHFDLNLGTITISSEVVFASLFGWIIFAEVPRTYDLYGATFIILAIIIGNLPSKQKSS